MNPKTLALMVVPLMTLRVVWGASPSLWLCALFWASTVALVGAWALLLHRRPIPAHGVVLVAAGAAMNGLVMIANGGMMPVVGKPADYQNSVWRAAQNGDHLLLLADNMAVGGLSPGDVLIVAGIAAGFAIGLVKAKRALFARLRPALG
jgi:hypothetical protein